MTVQRDIAPGFTGMYGIPEAALYLSSTPPLTNGNVVPAVRLRYWIRTSVPLLAPAVFPTRQRLITFLDLISMRMIAVLRSRNVKLKHIRNTEHWLRREFGIRYPLASRELWTCGSDVFIKFEEQLILAASRFGQEAMTFIGDWLSKVELDMTFDEHDLASSWCPYRYICLDPTIQFGAPCVEGTRVPTRSIWDKIRAGDSPEVVAALYDLDMAQVQYAIRWEQHIGTI